MLKKLFKCEWGRAVRGIYFKLSAAAGVMLAVCSAIEAFRLHYLWQLNNGVLGAEDSYPFTITEVWIGMDISSMYNHLFMILFPVFAVLPYALVSFEDKESGYLNQILIRESRRDFYLVRYLVTFITGGISVTIPSLLNIILGTLYAPIMPQSLAANQSYIHAGSFASEFFYQSPLGYVGIFMLIDFLWGGLFAALALSLMDVVKNKYIMLAFPFLLHMVAYYLVYYSMALFEWGIYSIVPFYFLNPMQKVALEPAKVLLLSFLVFMVTFGLFVLRNEKRDIL